MSERADFLANGESHGKNQSDSSPGQGVTFRASEEVENTIQKARIQSILEQRERFKERYNRVLDLESLENVNPRGESKITVSREGTRAIRKSLEHYIMEVEPIMAQTPKGKYCLEKINLGKLEFNHTDRPPVEFNGLRSILDTPEFYTLEWEQETNSFLEGRTTEEQSQTYQIPRPVLTRAYRVINDFLAGASLDISLADLRELEFDYSDHWGKAIQNVE